MMKGSRGINLLAEFTSREAQVETGVADIGSGSVTDL